MMYRQLSRCKPSSQFFTKVHRLSSTVALNGNPQYMEVATRLWVERFVMGHGMCPWAASTLTGNRLRICTIPGGVGTEEGMLEVCDNILEEARKLVEEDCSDDRQTSTTLIILPDFKCFDAFLELADVIEGVFDAENVDEFLQVATFHPDYKFADSDTEDLDIENFTNRSPFPVIHLLKVKEVSDAIESYNNGDTSTIWKKNKLTLKALGMEKVKAISAKILVDAALEVEKNNSGLKF